MRKVIRYNHKKIGSFFSILCLLALNSVGFAAPPFIEQNDNSRIQSGIRENTLPLPAKPSPKILVEPTVPTPSQPVDKSRIPVKKLQIIGQNIYGDAVWEPFIKTAENKNLTIRELETYADRVTQYFHEHGYIVARAVIPEQTIENGVIKIQVFVGKYDKIQVKNYSTLQQATIDRIIVPIKSGAYIQKSVLERVLLLMSETDGVESNAMLRAGSVQGTSNLILELKDKQQSTGQIYIDNQGSSYTGKNRLGINWNLHNISKTGDELSMGTIFGKDRDDYNINYQMLTGGQGAKLNIAYSRSHYVLGKGFADLAASGVAKTTSIYESMALTRSANYNFTVGIGFSHKELNDDIGSFNYSNRKSADIWSLGFNGDSKDRFAGGGYNNFSLFFAYGRLSLDSADAVSNDSLMNTAGYYSKANLSLYRIQHINRRLNLHLSFSGQLASKNLDSSEKISLGGPSGVRAYPLNEASGDVGYVGTGELRWNIPDPNVQLTAFIDSGYVILNKRPWTTDSNSRTLSGAGLGIIFSRPDNYAIRIDYAWKMSASAATSDSNSPGRCWVQAIKYF